MLPKINFEIKNRVIAIGVLHGVALLYALFEAISNIIEEERPVTDGDIVYVAVHISIHVFLISTLMLGANTGNLIFLLPWLIVSFPILVSVSYFTLKYSRFSYLSQFIFNICFICFGWYMWLTVCKFCQCCKNMKHKTEKRNITT